ncbi:FxLYD domain-containing protein [Rathayibacter festucae]|uniref:FxLYD domain-containing protein n=1 Tax=Rathayibacter festucae TaxID=110937 RepID=UPI002A69EA97|nr:FxLYD domain-containing protein [Rathayibacter festucae]MDY0912869.1 FxLYD domain-containing protein [Rathayibacter festucae]
MSENTPPPAYQVGDVVNGHRLTETVNGLQWIPVEALPLPTPDDSSAPVAKRSMPAWAWGAVGAGAVVVLATAIGIAVGVAGATDDVASAPRSSPTRIAEPDQRATEPTSPSRPSAQELILGETAFGVDPDSGFGWYVVALENPNADYIFTRGQLTVEAFDAAGVLLDSSNEYTTVLSGKTLFVGDFFDIGAAQIDHIELRGPTVASATYAAAAETGAMTTSITGSEMEYGYTEVTGTVTSTFSEDQEFVKVYVVSRDSAGAIVGGDYAYIDRLPAGGTAQFSTSVGKGMEGNSFEAYAVL